MKWPYVFWTILSALLLSCSSTPRTWNDLQGNPPDEEKLFQALNECDYNRKMKISKMHSDSAARRGIYYPKSNVGKIGDETVDSDIRLAQEYKNEAFECMLSKGFLKGYKVALEPNSE